MENSILAVSSLRHESRRILAFLLLSAFFTGISYWKFETFFSNNFRLLLPTFAILIVFIGFSLILRFRVDSNIFGEIGFIYLLFTVAYTVIPVYGFLALESLDAGDGFQNLAQLLPSQTELGVHLWRHFAFIATIALGYLMARGKFATRFNAIQNLDGRERIIIFGLLAIITLSVLFLSFLSAPVESYADNYIRYNHLPWLAKRLVTMCVIIKMGGSFILLTIMFKYYTKYKWWVAIFILILSVYEIKNSYGARIEVFFLVITASCLYHHCVKPITLKKGLIILILLSGVFTAVESFRAVNFEFGEAKETLTQKQGMPTGEFGALYVTGYHLYSERSRGTLPPVEWEMFFNDFISLVPLIDQTRWHPMWWYAKYYYPDAAVPPWTLGPIADSAIWGGEVDLCLRGLINGLLFAILARWFSRQGHRWQIMVVYVFCYATCIMCLKYSILYHMMPLFKLILPVVFIVDRFLHKIPKAYAGQGISLKESPEFLTNRLIP